jgi:exonuclease VII large subunit
MASLEIGIVAAIGFGGFALFYLSWLAASRRRRRAAPPAQAGSPAPAAAPAPASGVPVDLQARRLEQRLETLEEAQAELAERLAEGDGEARLKEMAASLVALIRDKNATLETALAGLDQLRTRLKTLENIGDLAEARGLFERLVARIETLEAAEARATARDASQGSPHAEIAEQLTRLYAQKDATVETVLSRLAPVEARLAEIEAQAAARDPEAALARLDERFTGRLETLQTRLEAGLATPAENPFAEISDQLTRLYAQKDAAVEAVLARLGPVETRLAALESGAGAALSPDDLAAAERRIEAQIDGRMAPRIEALQVRVAGLEAVDLDPLADLAGRLTALQDRRDAALDALAGRFVPIETRLGEMDEAFADLGAARNGIARLGEEIATLQAGETALRAEIARMAEGVETRAMDRLGERLAGLHARKEAAIEAVFARLGPVEAKLAELDGRLATLDAQTLLDRFAERLEVARAALQGQIDGLQAAVEGGIPAENPFAEISEQLTRLYAQKDATVETVFARLAPLEARLAEIEAQGRDPQAALDRIAERLEAARTALQDQIDDLRAAGEAPAENPFAEISEQLTRLYAQKDATVETVFARLAPLEARLVEIEAQAAARDPQAVLARFDERLAALQDRIAGIETGLGAEIDRAVAQGIGRGVERGAAGPLAELAARVAGLQAQRDAAFEAVTARLGPLEAQLAGIEGRIAGLDPQAALDRFADRLEAGRAALQGQIDALRTTVEIAGEAPAENPFAEIAEQLTRLYAQKDATVETVFARLAPLEAKLSEIEGRMGALDPAGPVDRLAARLEELRGALQAEIADLRGPGEIRFAKLAARVAEIGAGKEAILAALAERMAPLEAKLTEIESRGLSEDEARAEAQAVALQMIAAKTVAEETRLFANRISLLEASLPRLSLAQSLMMQALERQAAPWPAGEGGPATGPEAAPAQAPVASSVPPRVPRAGIEPDPAAVVPAPGRAVSPAAAEEEEELWQLPRVVSLHQSGQ